MEKEFKIGDRVKTSSPYISIIDGEISTKGDIVGVKYTVRFENGGIRDYDPMYLTYINSFKVCDRVVAKKDAPYLVTTNGWKGIVTKVCGKEIDVRGAGPFGVYVVYEKLDAKYFELDKKDYCNKIAKIKKEISKLQKKLSKIEKRTKC